MSVCLFSIPDEDIKANAIEVMASDYDSEHLWIYDIDENRVDLTKRQLQVLAEWALGLGGK